MAKTEQTSSAGEALVALSKALPRTNAASKESKAWVAESKRAVATWKAKVTEAKKAWPGAMKEAPPWAANASEMIWTKRAAWIQRLTEKGFAGFEAITAGEEAEAAISEAGTAAKAWATAVATGGGSATNAQAQKAKKAYIVAALNATKKMDAVSTDISEFGQDAIDVWRILREVRDEAKAAPQRGR
jgi:hypothetical protein